MFADLRQALRLLLKSPGFSALIVIVLAIGIGANTAIFSIINGVLLKPLPFPDAARLVALQSTVQGDDDGSASVPDVIDWQSARSLEGIVGYAGGSVILTGRGSARTLQTTFVTGDLFGALGATPLRGRSFAADDTHPGAAPTAVIAERVWAEQFNRDPSVVGNAATLDGQPFTIIGVMPESFNFPIQPNRVEVWLPIASIPTAAQLAGKRGAHFVHTIGRLRLVATLAQASSELAGIGERLAAEYPKSNAARGVQLVPLRERLVHQYWLTLAVLLGAVAMVLLIACANVANLLLARGVARRREVAIRIALGASRWRIVRQMLTESLLLSSAAGSAGVLVALWGLDAMVAASPVQIPRLEDVQIDLGVLLFACLISTGTGIIFGLIPALHVSRSDANETLKDTERGAGAHATRTRQALVVAEVALSLVLLAGAGLLARTLVAMQRVDLGFGVERTLAMDISLPDTRYPDAPARIAIYRRALESMRSMSGVASAAAASTLPLTGNGTWGIGFRIDGRPSHDEDHSNAQYHAVSPDYFTAMGIRLVRGRVFTDRDDEHAPEVIVISETMARKYWPNENPLGKRVIIGYGKTVPREIVGIVGDVKESALSERAQPEMYTPFPQTPWPFFTAVLRTTVDAPALAASLRAAVTALDPDQPPGDVKMMTQYFERAMAQPRFTAVLIGAFAGLATLLAGLGVYGVLAYGVAQRSREIGIRMALGAQAEDVRTLVVLQALRLGAAGLVIGLIGSLAAARVLDSLLFGVTASDPLTFATVSAALATVLSLAAYLPARRATRVDPVAALRVNSSC